MTARRSSPRRSAKYAWLITWPLALVAIACFVTFWVQLPHWYRWWPAGLAALAALIAAQFAVINVVIRRQSMSVAVTEIPLVLALYYLPPPMVILVVTVAVGVALLRARLGMTKLCFNVAKSATGASVALLVIAS